MEILRHSVFRVGGAGVEVGCGGVEVAGTGVGLREGWVIDFPFHKKLIWWLRFARRPSSWNAKGGIRSPRRQQEEAEKRVFIAFSEREPRDPGDVLTLGMDSGAGRAVVEVRLGRGGSLWEEGVVVPRLWLLRNEKADNVIKLDLTPVERIILGFILTVRGFAGFTGREQAGVVTGSSRMDVYLRAATEE